MKSGHKNQRRREVTVSGYDYSEVPHVGLANVAPLTKEELGRTYDMLTENGTDLTATRGEFIVRALMREMEILLQDAPEC